MLSKSFTVLHVEDNSDDLAFAARAFTRLGPKVDLHVACDGEAAIKGLSETRSEQATFPIPDFILLDLKMPKVDGFEVLIWLKAQEHLKMIPVFILSDSIYPHDEQKARDLGAVHFFQKPAHPLGFDAILSEALAKTTESGF